VTADGKLSAHFEHTVAVTEDGPVILTLPLAPDSGATRRARGATTVDAGLVAVLHPSLQVGGRQIPRYTRRSGSLSHPCTAEAGARRTSASAVNVGLVPVLYAVLAAGRPAHLAHAYPGVAICPVHARVGPRISASTIGRNPRRLRHVFHTVVTGGGPAGAMAAHHAARAVAGGAALFRERASPASGLDPPQSTSDSSPSRDGWRKAARRRTRPRTDRRPGSPHRNRIANYADNGPNTLAPRSPRRSPARP